MHALLEEVRAAVRAVLEERERIAGMAVLAQHHHSGLWVRFTQDRRGAYSLVRLRGRHADVGQNHVRLVARDGVEQRVEIAARGDHVDLGFRRKELHEPFAHDEAVFG